MVDKNNISTNESEQENNHLKEFLKENLSDEFVNSFDDDIENNAFIKDALEGLQSFSSTKKIRNSVRELNQKLHQSTKSKKKTKPFEFNQIFWYIIAVVIIILLILLAFSVIRLRK